MTSSGLYVVVDPPRGTTPRGATIVRSANPVTEQDPHWIAGLRWRPLVCGSSGIDTALLVCGGAFSGFTTLSQPGNVDYVPPTVAVGLACSAISGEQELRDTRVRATDLLDRCETLGIARELWRGTAALAEAPDLPNDYLAKGSTMAPLNGSAATHAIDALAWLEDALAAASCAGGSMIHCSPYTATVWASCHLLDRQADGRLLTALGTVVVADPGYDGSASDGSVDATKATAWAYGTGMVDLRRGPVQVLPSEDLTSGITRSNNDFHVYASRPFAATFDPCAHVGIKVDHAVRS